MPAAVQTPSRERSAIEDMRRDFPTISAENVYLDSVASSLTPLPVIEAMTDYYMKYRANVHRGSYDLSLQASEQFEAALANVARFIGARPEEIVVTSNATQALNEVALSLDFQPGDEVVVSSLEHSSNILPWKRLAKKVGINLVWYKPAKSGFFDLDRFEQVLTPRTRLVALTYVSNVLGSSVPVDEVARICRERGILYLVDASQAAPHMPIDVRRIGCDFLAFSGHKMLGPTGVGILYLRQEHAETLIPAFLGGGTMDTSACHCTTLEDCSIDECTFSELPHKWLAGTPPIAEMLGLSAAVDYLDTFGFDAIMRHDARLMEHALPGLLAIDGIELFGPDEPAKRTSILSFNIGTLPPSEVGRILNEEFAIAVRAGDHCAVNYFRDVQELERPKGNVRASFYLYNTEEEVDRLLAAVRAIARTCL
jgi:cysteine desulfurase / selenocysteine lyase